MITSANRLRCFLAIWLGLILVACGQAAAPDSPTATAGSSADQIQPTGLPPQPTVEPISAPIVEPIGVDIGQRWLDGMPCKPPCWEGITPGQTSADQAVSALSQSRLIISPVTRDSGAHGVLSWQWAGGSVGGEAMYEGASRTIKSVQVELPRPIRLGDIMAAYGEPEYIQATMHYSSGWITYYVYLIYLQQGFTVGMSGDSRPQLDEGLEMQRIVLFSPEDASYASRYRDSPGSLAWQGMQDFATYCRSEGTPEGCRTIERLAGLDQVVATEVGRDPNYQSPSGQLSQTIELEGFYEAGFEYAGFHLCGNGETWLLSWNTSGIVERYLALTKGDRQPMYVRARGVVGPVPTVYPALDEYVAVLEQAELLEMREPQPGDCE